MRRLPADWQKYTSITVGMAATQQDVDEGYVLSSLNSVPASMPLAFLNSPTECSDDDCPAVREADGLVTDSHDLSVARSRSLSHDIKNRFPVDFGRTLDKDLIFYFPCA